MGGRTPTAAKGLRAVNPQEYYRIRCEEFADMFVKVLREVPPHRQQYYLELWRGIDKRITEAYNGTQDNPHGTT